MLYLILEKDNQSGYHLLYNTEIRKIFNDHKVKFQEIQLEKDYLSKTNLERINLVQSNNEDIWLFAFAQNPLIEKVFYKPGRKFAHIHGLEALSYEPAVLHGYRLFEESLLYYYDGLFVNSEYALSIIKNSYPGLATKTFVSGFPFDSGFAEKFKNIPKDDRVVAFNQRFDTDKLHTLEVYICDRLIDSGYSILRLCSKDDYERIQWDREARNLLSEAVKMGVQVIVTNSKDDYYRNLASAKFTVTTSIADTLSLCMLEAAALGSIPVAPANGPFKEYIDNKNLYNPYNIDQLLNIIEHSNKSAVDLEKYSPEKVFGIYMDSMGVK